MIIPSSHAKMIINNAMIVPFQVQELVCACRVILRHSS